MPDFGRKNRKQALQVQKAIKNMSRDDVTTGTQYVNRLKQSDIRRFSAPLEKKPKFEKPDHIIDYKPERYKPPYYCSYYAWLACEIVKYRWESTLDDYERYDKGNCYRNEQACLDDWEMHLENQLELIGPEITYSLFFSEADFGKIIYLSFFKD